MSVASALLPKAEAVLSSDGLDAVQAMIMDSLRQTALGPMIDEWHSAILGGKMLRARLALEVGAATGAPRDTLLRAAAAVEMVHAASLLHDDVIDNATLRRGAPSFWRLKGASGAVLLGDLLVCEAMKILHATAQGALTAEFVHAVAEMCAAESEQELLRSNGDPDWDTCVRIARGKTGALFGFVGHVCGGECKSLSLALKEAGRMIGTAYQLADDILDASGDSAFSGKTLGTDSVNGKVTAASTYADVDPVKHVYHLCDQAVSRVSDWPAVREALHAYVVRDFLPVVDTFVAAFSPRRLSDLGFAEVLHPPYLADWRAKARQAARSVS